MSADNYLFPRIAHGATPKPRFLDNLARKLLFNQLSKLHDGRVVIEEDGNLHYFGKQTERCNLSATIHVTYPAFYSDITFGGSIGAGEAYMHGYWFSDDLTNLMRIMSCNLDIVDNLEGGLDILTRTVQKILHWLNRNTYKNSKRNISAHYDLGNEFFKLMLDKSMMYSCAIFPDKNADLYQAQIHRLDIICQKLDLKPGEHLLEIGTGWGGLAIHAAKHYGCSVTTTTISQEQFNLAQARIKDAGLEDKITLLLKDYRVLEGTYDKIVSVEMIEAVGYEFFDTYFKQCSQLLKPQGVMLLQAITIADKRYEQTKRSVDFIQRYIFPGGCLPSVTAIANNITKHTDLQVLSLDEIGHHYATTLNTWRQNIHSNIGEIHKLGYSETFLRMWNYYLCYCEGAFHERAIGTVHMLLGRADYRA